MYVVHCYVSVYGKPCLAISRPTCTYVVSHLLLGVCCGCPCLAISWPTCMYVCSRPLLCVCCGKPCLVISWPTCMYVVIHCYVSVMEGHVWWSTGQPVCMYVCSRPMLCVCCTRPCLAISWPTGMYVVIHCYVFVAEGWRPCLAISWPTCMYVCMYVAVHCYVSVAKGHVWWHLLHCWYHLTPATSTDHWLYAVHMVFRYVPTVNNLVHGPCKALQHYTFTMLTTPDIYNKAVTSILTYFQYILIIFLWFPIHFLGIFKIARHLQKIIPSGLWHVNRNTALVRACLSIL